LDDARKLRRHIHSALQTMSNGYFKMRGIPIQALPAPAPEAPPLGNGQPGQSDQPESDKVGEKADEQATLAQPDDMDSLAEDALPAQAAFVFMQWLRENRQPLKLQPAFRRASDHVLNKFAMEPSAAISKVQALSTIVCAVCSELHPEWCNEIQRRPESGHFFEDKSGAMSFMTLRYSYIVALFEQFCCGSARVSLGDDGSAELTALTDVAEKVHMLRIGDAGQESVEDHFNSSFAWLLLLRHDPMNSSSAQQFLVRLYLSLIHAPATIMNNYF